MPIKDTGNEGRKLRKFIYKHPLFGRGDWKSEPQKIRETKKGVRWDRSVYYWWFQYLLRHEGYKRQCETGSGEYDALYADFGDIHAFKENFKGWFNECGAELFAEPFAELSVEQLDVDDDVLVDDERVIYLQVPIYSTQKRLTNCFCKPDSHLQ